MPRTYLRKHRSTTIRKVSFHRVCHSDSFFLYNRGGTRSRPARQPCPTHFDLVKFQLFFFFFFVPGSLCVVAVGRPGACVGLYILSLNLSGLDEPLGARRRPIWSAFDPPTHGSSALAYGRFRAPPLFKIPKSQNDEMLKSWIQTCVPSTQAPDTSLSMYLHS